MKQAAGIYLFLALALATVQSARAEVIFFDDSDSRFMVAPTSTRWTPGHDGGICSAFTALPGSPCGPGSGSEQAVWGYLAAPTSQQQVTLDTDLSHYDVLHPAIPFDDFLWVTEQQNIVPDLYSDYLYSLSYRTALYLQFNSAFSTGFSCTNVLVPTDCANPHTIAEADGIVTAGWVLWSDGSFDQITFQSIDLVIDTFAQVPEPSSLLLLATGFLPFWRSRKARPQSA